MDIARPDQSRAKRIKRIVYATLGVLLTAGVTVGVSYLRPAAPLCSAPLCCRRAVAKSRALRVVGCPELSGSNNPKCTAIAS